MPLGLVLNPTSDPLVTHTAQLDIAEGTTYKAQEAQFPPPAPKPAYASSYDTEGSVATDAAHYENREITIKLLVVGTSTSTLETALTNLTHMVGLINSEGGSLKLTTPNSTVCYFDLVPEGSASVTTDMLYVRKNLAEVTCTFQARPFWRGAEIDLGTISETTLPALVGVWPTTSMDAGITLTAASSEEVTRTDETALDLGDVVTMEAWVKRGSTGTVQSIISKGQNAYLMRFNAANNLELVRSGIAVIVASTTTITDTTTWHHVAATKTGATSKLYIDGVDRTGAVTNATFTDNALTFRVGGDDDDANGSASNFFNGSIYGAALYSTAVSGARIAVHAAQTSASSYGTEVLADSPVLFWKLNEPSGTNADDSTANNRDGTYVNTPTLGVAGPLTSGAVTSIKGDVPALGRLIVTDTESGGKDRFTVIVGGESHYYNSGTAATTSNLFLQAEALTPTGTSAIAAGATGASGSGSNVMRNTDLTTTYQAVLKSTLLSGTASLTHKGTFRVWARTYRPTGNTGAVSIRLEWAEGDFLRVTQNDAVTFAADEREGVFVWSNLGVVSIDPSSTRWEFRLLAKSTTVGDELDTDCFVVFSTEVVYTELSGKLRADNPSAFSARDEFDSHSAAALAGKTAPIGGVWTGGGDTDDFLVAAPGAPSTNYVTRTNVSDTAARVDWVPTSLTNFAVQAHVMPGTLGVTGGAAGVEGVDMAGVIGAVDASNFVAFAIKARNSERVLEVSKTIASTKTVLAKYSVEGKIVYNRYYALRLVVDAAGRWWAWWDPNPASQSEIATRVANLTLVMSGYDSTLATGGTLATRKPGLVDYCSQSAGSSLPLRFYENFFAWAVVPDAAIFTGQSLTLGANYATREDSTGTFSTNISDRRGRYLKIPPAGPEGRSTRLVVMALRNDPYTMGDVAAIDDLSAQLYVTPRGLVVPEA